MSDAPTQRFDAQPPANSNENKPKSRLPLILGIAGGILLIIVIILVYLLLRGNQGTPLAASTTTPSPTQTTTPTSSASPVATPTPTPSASHTNAPPPPKQGTSIQFFLIDNSTHPVVYCNTQAPNPVEIDLSFHWASTDVSKVYLGVNTTDASEGPLFSDLPPSGTQANFPPGYDPYSYPCPSASQEFTMTVIGNNGHKVSRTVTVLNKGDTH